jgi:MoxR-like ATPase
MKLEASVEANVQEAAELAGRIRKELAKAVVGQAEAVDGLLACLIAAGHVLLEGVPGVGKTLVARALAQSFGGQTSRVQFTPDLMPADVVGHVLYEAATGTMRLRKGPAFTHLLLADEINRAPAKTQAALLEVMQERQVTIEGESLSVPNPFMAIATQNPIEMEGTYPLPEAQLDRFLMKVRFDYPSEAEEVELTRHVTDGRVGDALPLEAVSVVATAEDVVRMQVAAALLTVDERVLEYAVRIARATREVSGVAVGAGPRGAIALIRVARAFALLEARSFVVPDDVKRPASAVLRHRILLAPEAELEARTSDDVVAAVLETVPAPRT